MFFLPYTLYNLETRGKREMVVDQTKKYKRSKCFHEATQTSVEKKDKASQNKFTTKKVKEE